MSNFNGPLRICADNPRYFSDASGKAIYLTGSHTWHNLRDIGHTDPPEAFDYPAYLDLMQRHHHNFMRMWSWELTQYLLEGKPAWSAPHPWPRIGPEAALDGKPRFDLERFDQPYFDRLRQRVAAAGQRGIYVSIMLFEGWGLQHTDPPWCRDGHPFCRHNNVNGIDGDPDDTGRMLDTHMLKHRPITTVQEAYVRKVIETVNDLDNVLYEIANESGAYSTQWQYHMIDFIHATERAMPKQHPAGMTFQSSRTDKGTNQALFDGPADWISPNPEGGYRDDPPPADGRKVILSDTDHLWGLGCAPGWIWKSFTRGMTPLLMDPIRPFPGIDKHTDWGPVNHPDHPIWAPARREMGDTRRFAERINLTRMLPRPDLASSGYCLANPGTEYLVYLPQAGEVTVDLSGAEGAMHLEWFNPQTSGEGETGRIEGGARETLRAPFDGEAVVLLTSRP